MIRSGPGCPPDKAVTAWYALPGDEIAARLGVDPAAGLSAACAAELLAKNGPNALPVEQPPSAVRRFLAEYTSYMQMPGPGRQRPWRPTTSRTTPFQRS